MTVRTAEITHALMMFPMPACPGATHQGLVGKQTLGKITVPLKLLPA